MKRLHRRRFFLRLLASTIACAGVSAGIWPARAVLAARPIRLVPRRRLTAIHLLPETDYGLRVALFGMGDPGVRAIGTAAASPLAMAYGEWQALDAARAGNSAGQAAPADCFPAVASGKIILNLPSLPDRHPGWRPANDDGAALGVLEIAPPSLSLIATDGDDQAALAAAVGRAEGMTGMDAHCAVFALSRRAAVAWPDGPSHRSDQPCPGRPRLSMITVLAAPGDEDEHLSAAVLAVLGAARGFGVIGVDMADVACSVFGGRAGYAVSATVPADRADLVSEIIAAEASCRGLDLRRTRRALIAAVTTASCGLPVIDRAISGVRKAIGDGSADAAPLIVMAGQFADGPENRIRVTLLAFVEAAYS